MTKEQQDLAWKCLPRETRDFVQYQLKAKYGRLSFDDGYNQALIDIFGSHNLTSSTEPLEMLMVEKKKAQDFYKDVQDCLDRTEKILGRHNHNTIQYRGILVSVKELFGNKCIPDKEPLKIDAADSLISMAKDEMNITNPKFDIGQKVRAKGTKQIGTIKEPCSNDIGYRVYFEDGDGGWDKEYPAEDLEPYTEEKETIKMKTLEESLPGATKIIDENFDYLVGIKDNMEEKELNLCELLKGCEGEEFYSLTHGDVKLEVIHTPEVNKPTYYLLIRPGFRVGREVILSNGKRDMSGVVILYPSRALYEKYPLDAYTAWMEWKESRDKKTYMQINVFDEDGDVLIDKVVVNITQEQVEQIVTEVNEVLRNLTKRKLRNES